MTGRIASLGRVVKTGLLVLLLLGSFWMVPNVVGQDVVEISRLQGPVALDGVVDESAWEAIEPLPMVMSHPTFEGPTSETTEIRVAHDGDYLYVGARCYDRDPEGIRGLSFRRNYNEPHSDNISLIVDTFNDNENALAFVTFPTGARTDFAVFNDAQGDEPVNFDWNGFWDAAASQDDEGWYAEMRIPFSTLGFQEEDGRVIMGLIAHRHIARKNETVSFPPLERVYGPWSWVKPSLAQKVVLEGIRNRRPLYVTPYVLGGLGQEAHLNGTGTAYERQNEAVREIGLDVGYNLTNNLTLDLTLNTDFAQVEADDQQVNLTRYSLFFPEKRRFFQERSSTFDFRFGEEDRLFYSRRVGLHEGQPIRILGGARLVGRVKDWDVGLFSMQTAREPDILATGEALPSENLGVVRMRRRVFNPYSYVGGMVTSRISEKGDYDAAYGFDGILRLFGDDYFMFNWAHTFDNDAETDAIGLEAVRLQGRWERRAHVGLGYNLIYSRSGRVYEPGLGFELRHDYTRLGDQIRYGWLSGEASSLARHFVSLNSTTYLRNADGTVESAIFGAGWTGELKSGAEFDLQLRGNHESLRTPFALSDDAEVPVGRYTFYEVEASYITSHERLWMLGLDAAAGSFFDGRRYSFGVEPSWRMSRHLSLEGTYEFNRIVFPDRDQQFDAHIGQLRIDAALDTRYLAAAFLQYNSAAGRVTGNVRFRYNPREGNDLYLVFNEDLNTDRHGFDPTPPLTDRRAIMVKYTYTFTL